ncbi:hypothetical protein PVIIG_05281 [Plasmodium vivax India VII]|uniref:Uncharacterized protein n=1 Tax=Plasmodium vivax India VII TaxID=1077284 RepID=A0A0J9SK34_PLAVI|nr:hypothetical protein PVIIG_05281 [Plasmodium vivax India VII]
MIHRKQILQEKSNETEKEAIKRNYTSNKLIDGLNNINCLNIHLIETLHLKGNYKTFIKENSCIDNTDIDKVYKCHVSDDYNLYNIPLTFPELYSGPKRILNKSNSRIAINKCKVNIEEKATTAEIAHDVFSTSSDESSLKDKHFKSFLYVGLS